MSQLVKVRSVSYDQYEELLLRRDDLRKKALQYEDAYVELFGELLNSIFEQKISCIEKKKIIAYCQRILNRGGVIDPEKLFSHIEKVMQEYYDELHDRIKGLEELKNREGISEYAYRKIKKLYRKIAGLIHPDMNPKLKDDPAIQDLWNRAVVAYHANALKEIEEVYALVNAYLEKIGYKRDDFEIPDLDSKIEALEEEIETIKNTDPYCYRYLLEDKEACEEKRKDLEAERKEYETYAEELEEVIRGFGIRRSLA